MRKFTAILCLLSLLQACEIPFDFRPESGPRIYVQGFAENGRITVYPYYAADVNGEEALDTPMQVIALLNGTSLGGRLVKPGRGAVFSADVAEGDEVLVQVSCDGLSRVEGSTRIPPRPEVLDLWQENVQVDTIRACRITLVTDHTPAEGEYYGLQIFMRTRVGFVDGSSEVFTSFLTPGYILSVADSGLLDLADFVQVNYNNGVMGAKDYSPLTLITPKHFDGPAYSFYLNSFDANIMDMIRRSGEEAPGEVAGPVVPNPGKIPISTEAEYFFGFYRLSEEFYRYARTLYQSNFDILSNMGFTPANFTWSNVNGGLGFVGALSSTWVGPVVIDEEN